MPHLHDCDQTAAPNRARHGTGSPRGGSEYSGEFEVPASSGEPNNPAAAASAEAAKGPAPGEPHADGAEAHAAGWQPAASAQACTRSAGAPVVEGHEQVVTVDEPAAPRQAAPSHSFTVYELHIDRGKARQARAVAARRRSQAAQTAAAKSDRGAPDTERAPADASPSQPLQRKSQRRAAHDATAKMQAQVLDIEPQVMEAQLTHTRATMFRRKQVQATATSPPPSEDDDGRASPASAFAPSSDDDFRDDAEAMTSREAVSQQPAAPAGPAPHTAARQHAQASNAVERFRRKRTRSKARVGALPWSAPFESNMAVPLQNVTCCTIKLWPWAA